MTSQSNRITPESIREEMIKIGAIRRPSVMVPTRELTQRQVREEMMQIGGLRWPRSEDEIFVNAHQSPPVSFCEAQVNGIDQRGGRACPKGQGEELDLEVDSSCCEPNNGKFYIDKGGWKNLAGMDGVSFPEENSGPNNHGKGPERKRVKIDLDKFPYDIKDGAFQFKWEGDCDQKPGKSFRCHTSIGQSSNCEKCPDFSVVFKPNAACPEREECYGPKDEKITLEVTNLGGADADTSWVWYLNGISPGNEIKECKGKSTCEASFPGPGKYRRITARGIFSNAECSQEIQSSTCFLYGEEACPEVDLQMSSSAGKNNACRSGKNVELEANPKGVATDKCTFKWTKGGKDGEEIGTNKRVTVECPGDGKQQKYTCMVTYTDPGSCPDGETHKGQIIVYGEGGDPGKACDGDTPHLCDGDVCQECCEDKHCDEGEKCKNGKCIDPCKNQPCSTYSQAFGTCTQDCTPPQQCCEDVKGNEVCQECCNDNHCADGKHCEDGKCVDDPVCGPCEKYNRNKDKCVSKCPDDKPHCLDDVCQECIQDSHCPGGHCDDGTCVDGEVELQIVNCDELKKISPGLEFTIEASAKDGTISNHSKNEWTWRLDGHNGEVLQETTGGKTSALTKQASHEFGWSQRYYVQLRNEAQLPNRQGVGCSVTTADPITPGPDPDPPEPTPEPTPECTTDADCPPGQICKDGKCVDGPTPNPDPDPPTPEPTPECTTDKDCPPGQICEDGKCVPGCRKDEDCPDGHICEDGVCVPGCRDDYDCPGDEYCEDGVCVKPPECYDDADCEEDEICTDGECHKGCRADEDCPPGQICIDGVCHKGCRIDKDCPPGKICEDGVCVPAPPECKEDKDCPPGQICEDGKCVPGCRDDDDCCGDQICKDGECVNPDQEKPEFDPCEGVECPDNAKCKDGLCECEEGFIEVFNDGKQTCEPVCKDPNSHYNADDGECYCNNGFLWDPESETCKEQCEPEPPPGGDGDCGTEDPCHGVTCLPPKVCVKGECVCPEGTIEDEGGLCLPEDLCLNVLCPPNSTCIEGTCVCDEGYLLNHLGYCQASETPCDLPDPACASNAVIQIKAGSGLGGGGSFRLNQACDKTILLWVDTNKDVVDASCDENGMSSVCSCTGEITQLMDMIVSLKAEVEQLKADNAECLERNECAGFKAKKPIPKSN